MRNLIVAIACAIASSIAVADPTPAPGGPYQGTGIDAGTYLVDKTVDFSVARSLPYRYPYWVSFENVIASGERLMVLMDSRSKPGKNTNLEPVAIRKLNTVEIPRVAPETILIDSNGSDWGLIPTVLTDSPTDSSQPSLPGSDLVSLQLARDDTFLYGRVNVTNQPDGSVMYVFELVQSVLQMNAAGDVLVNCARHGMKPGGPLPPWSCVVHDRNGAFRANYPPGTPDGPQGAVAAGNDFIEWMIPLKDLQYQAFPMFPVAGKIDKGIDNRFIHLYAHPQGSTPSDSMGTVPWGKPLIIRFYE